MVVYYSLASEIAKRITSDEIPEVHSQGFAIQKIFENGEYIVLDGSEEIPEGFIEESHIYEQKGK